MSLGTLFARSTGTRTPEARNRRLRDEKAQLAADLETARLSLDAARADRSLLYNAWQDAEGTTKRAEDMVDLQRVKLGKNRAEIELLQRQLAAQTDELNALRAFKANAEKITVPPAERDTSDMADQATAPIDVSNLRKQHFGPVMPLGESPMANPGHIPAWADTQPIPVA
jgi:chromosome segregation ATPase